jgi:hypothetical protein
MRLDSHQYDGGEAVSEIGDAEIQQMLAAKTFWEKGSFSLGIYMVSLKPNCSHLSSKVFPVIVKMDERKGEELLTDIYSFDHNGVLLSHGYSTSRKGEMVVDEEHDLSLERLVQNGKIIQEMIRNLPLPFPLTSTPIMGALRNNSFGRD